jgi:hypothetical protein
MSDSMTEALEASTQKRALYQDEERRAFVSIRGSNFDVGVKSPVGRATRFNQKNEQLQTLLNTHNIPTDQGWKAVQKRPRK